MAARVELELGGEALEALDRAVAAGRFPDRASAIQEGLRRLLHIIDLSDAYERAYTEYPEDERFGNVGLELMAERVRGDDRSR